MKRHVVALSLTDDIPVFELAVPCEVFGIDRSDLADPWYELRLCAAEPGPLSVRSGLTVQPPYGLEGLADADTVLVPACNRTVQCGPPSPLVDAVRAAHARGARIASICSGAYVLAAAGLLDGRRATTHWMNMVDFAHRYPEVKVDREVLYVDEGDVLTSAGTGSAIDLCLHLVRCDFGAAVANEVARRMVVPPHREGGQSQFAHPLARGDHRADDITPVLEWARERLGQPLTGAQLAAQAHLSPRTFARRFRDGLGVSPLQWILEQRIRLAQELLETTDEPIERIAWRTGFGTAVNMRQHFRRFTSISPHTYRQTFRRPVSA